MLLYASGFRRTWTRQPITELRQASLMKGAMALVVLSLTHVVPRIQQAACGAADPPQANPTGSVSIRSAAQLPAAKPAGRTSTAGHGAKVATLRLAAQPVAQLAARMLPVQAPTVRFYLDPDCGTELVGHMAHPVELLQDIFDRFRILDL